MNKKNEREMETNIGRRRLSASDAETPKSNKRRKREPVSATATDDNKEQLLDPSSVAVATAVKRSSRFRGVSRHRWTGRYEAHLWDKGTWNATQKKKGKQVYLGAYDQEESAARAYDLAALKYWGPTTFTNFPVSDYEKEIELMQNVTREEYLASLRRKSSGFSRGVSKYRGVARHHHNGRWEARIGRVFGNKYLYLGTYSTQEEAAAAYDVAAIEYRGINAVTNFDLSTYIRWLRPGTNGLITTSQETHPDGQVQMLPSLPNEKPPSTFSPHNTISVTDDDIGSPQKQEYNIPSGFHSSSSSTALSLLLRSSIFRELVEKNPNAADNENEVEELRDEHQMDEFGAIFYAGMGDIQYRNDVELAETAPPFYNRVEQSLWSNAISMSSMQ